MLDSKKGQLFQCHPFCYAHMHACTRSHIKAQISTPPLPGIVVFYSRYFSVEGFHYRMRNCALESFGKKWLNILYTFPLSHKSVTKQEGQNITSNLFFFVHFSAIYLNNFYIFLNYFHSPPTVWYKLIH